MVIARYLSMFFYGLLIFYFYLGMFVLAQDVKNRFHQAFFAITMALSTWSLSFSLLSHAGTLRGATIFQFTSGFGWGFVYSFLLVFTILLTGYQKKMTRVKWMLVYAPIFITMGTYAYSFFTGALEEQIYYGPYGWTLRFQWAMWSLWTRIYYMGVLGAIIVLLRQWTPGKEVFIQGRYKKLLSFSLLVPMVLGLPKILGLLDLVNRVPFGLGPLVFLPFTMVMLYIMIQKAKAERREEVVLPKRGEFLSTKTHERIYVYLSQGYIFGAFLSFFVQIILKENYVLQTSFMTFSLFLMGYTVFFLVKSNMDPQKRDNIINAITAMTIPYITLYQVESSAFFAWTVPILLTLVAVAFNNTKLLITTSFMTIGTLIFLWMLYPNTRGTFGSIDHLSRLLVMVIFILLAFFINDIYRKRLKQFEKQVDHERFISDMSMLLSKARLENLRSNVEIFLEEVVDYMQASFGTIHIFSDEKDGVLRKFLKHEEHPSALIEKHLNHAKILDDLLGETVRAQHTEEFITKLIEGYKTGMEERKVMTFILPIVESEKVIGVIALSTIDGHQWDEGDENTFAIIVKNLSAMLYKIKKEDELYHLAYYDALTDLPNRVLFKKILEEAIEKTEEDEYLAVLFVDLDDFKNINDLLGHSVGDELLKAFVRRIKPLLQEETDMSRFGGDEFLILLPHLKNLEDIHKKATEILAATLAPFVFDEREIATGASIGISVYPTDARRSEDLIRYADLAMYHAKNHGKNRYTILSNEIKGRFVYEKEMENELYRALKNKEFVLYYQPRVDAHTEEIIGVEALIRWQHPEKGLLSPGIFLPVAERIGLMAEIDRWVFEEACEQNRRWQQTCQRYISMSINVSPLTFTAHDNAALFGNYLKERYWDPAYLEVEITENTMYFSVDSTKEKIEALRGLGIIVSLDDFGIAYSSLSRLHELPIDKIKIDRQFILNLDKGKSGRNLFDGMVHLSKSLGLLLNVEGVETKEQAEYVKKQGCDEIQGFYYHRPMPAEKVEKLLVVRDVKEKTPQKLQETK